MTVPQEVERRKRDGSRDPSGLEEPNLAPRAWNRAPPDGSFELVSHYQETVSTPVQSRILSMRVNP